MRNFFDVHKILRFKTVTKMYDYVFSENGLVAYKNGELAARQVSCTALHHFSSYLHFYFQSIKTKMGEEKLQTFVNFCLRYMSELKLPKKRSVFNFMHMINFITTLQGHFY